MTREVPARAATWLAVLLSFGAATAALPADAAPRHAKHHAHHAVQKKPVSRHKGVKHAHAKNKKTHVAAKAGKRKTKVLAHARPATSHAQAAGPLRVSASSAYIVDQETGEVLFGKSPEAVLPIASLTKLMTGMVLAEAQLPMDDKITIDDADVDRLKFSSSRLKVGTELTREQALHLALMSSENRAAHALARTYPGGVTAFVSAMNVKAQQLGMDHTRYVEPTGLSSDNKSTAHDLALLTAAASQQPLLRRYTTSPAYRLATDDGSLQYVNSNGLVRAGTWKIAVQKTGYIHEAGYTLLMQAKVAGRKLVMVFLDSASKLARLRDPERVRAWLNAHPDLTAKDKGDEPG